MREFENDINIFIDNFIGSVIGKIDLGTLDNIFKGLMIGGFVLIIVLTAISLLFYKFFDRKKVRVTAYVMYSTWILISLAATFVIVALTYNWFSILNPIEGAVDPLIEKFRELVNTTDTTRNFFEGFVGSVFGKNITLGNLSTQAVVKFLLAIPLIICWVNLGFVAIVLFSIIFGPKFSFIKITTQVAYFMIFIILMVGGIWALVLSIQTDIKVATSIELLLKSQAHIITNGVMNGMDSIKDDLDGFLDHIIEDLDNLEGQDLGNIVDQIINVDNGIITIMGDGDNSIVLDLEKLSDMLGIDENEITDKIDDFKNEFASKGKDGAKEALESMKDWIANNLK